jgi:hypothetical protein
MLTSRTEISIFAFPLVISKIRILLRQESNLKPAGLRPAGNGCEPGHRATNQASTAISAVTEEG